MDSLIRKTRIIIMIFVWLTSFSAAQVSFTRHTITDSFEATMSIYAIDVDSDGDRDVLGASYGSNTIAWWENDGSQNFTFHVISDDFGGARVVHADDIDGDQDIDILGAAAAANRVSVWENDGNQNFTEHILSEVFYGAHTVYDEDIDGDGDKDIIASAWSSVGISWWENLGDWNFTEHIISQGGSDYPCVYATDIDGDEDIDVVAAICQNGRVNWWENTGNEVFVENIVSLNFAGAHWVYAIDVDNDTDVDLLGAAYGANRISWWENDGNQAFYEHPLSNNFMGATSVYAEDIDSDGFIDILGAAEQVDQIRWWRNDGTANFNQYFVTTDFEGASHVFAIDLDNDSDTDVLGAGRFGNELAWWANNTYQFEFEASVLTGHAPLTVEFTDMSYADWDITQWAWDFENDGSIDSYEQNPSWTYEEPGDYSIHLTLSNGDNSRDVLYQDYIHVFNGFSALEFDGYESHAACPASESINLTGELTLEAWIKPYGWGENLTMGLGKIIDKEKYTIFLIESSAVFRDSSLIFQVRDSSGHTIMANSELNSITIDEWQHIAVVYQNTGEVDIYVNDIAQDLYMTGQPSGGIEDNSLIDLIIGDTHSGNKAFDGILDEIRIWNYARSWPEIEADMNRRLSGNESGLAAYWPMDEGNGQNIYDNTGNGNDALISEVEWVQGIQLVLTSIEQLQDKSKPSRVVLTKAYPNPFNGSTVIAFETSIDAYVVIDIYDVLGRKVDSILDDYLSAGNHIATWNAGHYSSGIYIYRLDINGLSGKSKLLLLK